MVNSPKISIITPSYNQCQFIEQTITTVLNQGYSNLEYIIIDGNSTDKTIEIIEKYSDRLTYWVSEPDRGQTHAINKGFQRATGDIIAWLNSDDLYCQGALAIVGSYFAEHPECMWLCGNILFADESGRITARKKPYFTLYLLRYGSSSVYQSNVFVRREVLDEIGFLDENFELMMDREWFCRIAEKYRPDIIDNDLAIYRFHASTKSFSPKGSRLYHRNIVERSILTTRYAPRLEAYLQVIPRQIFFILDQIGRVIKLCLRIKKIFIMNGLG